MSMFDSLKSKLGIDSEAESYVDDTEDEIFPGGQGGGLLQRLDLRAAQVQPAADIPDGNILRILLAGGVQFVNGLCAQAVHGLLIFAAQLVP